MSAIEKKSGFRVILNENSDFYSKMELKRKNVVGPKLMCVLSIDPHDSDISTPTTL